MHIVTAHQLKMLHIFISKLNDSSKNKKAAIKLCNIGKERLAGKKLIAKQKGPPNVKPSKVKIHIEQSEFQLNQLPVIIPKGGDRNVESDMAVGT